MLRAEKEQLVNEVVDKLTSVKSVFVTDFSGLNVEEINELRRFFREAGVEYRVIKNTLARLAVRKAGYERVLEYLNGATALAFGIEDPVAPARVIAEFTKKKEKPTIKACIFEGAFMDSSRATEIANLPPKEVLMGRAIVSLNSPISRFVGTLSGLLSNLVFVLNAIKEKQHSGRIGNGREEN